jgi:hypothetical protein
MDMLISKSDKVMISQKAMVHEDWGIPAFRNVAYKQSLEKVEG